MSKFSMIIEDPDYDEDGVLQDEDAQLEQADLAEVEYDIPIHSD